MHIPEITERLNKLIELIKKVNIPNNGKQHANEKKPLRALSKTREALQETKNPYTLPEILDYLRIAIKYLVFDLEATRRENTTLKKILKESQS